MKEALLNKLNPANLSLDSKEAIEALTVEELKELAKTYPANKNYLEVKNSETGVKFFAHYGSLIWHKTRFPNAQFELVDVMPSVTTVAKGIPIGAPEKVLPPNSLEKTGEEGQVKEQTEEEKAAAAEKKASEKAAAAKKKADPKKSKIK